LCGLLALAAAAGGCQGGQKWTLVPVEGTVSRNGRPLANVEVVFLADSAAGTQGPRASGTTDQAGRYRLRTDYGEDGAALGQHRVILRDRETARKHLLKGLRRKEMKEVAEVLPENAGRAEESKRSADTPRVPPKYERFPSTPLRATVGSEPLVFDIRLP
jgi:hypothetical protein